MTDSDDSRLKFYGPGDLATGWQTERAAALLARFGSGSRPHDIAGVLELHNAQLFAEGDFLPASFTDAERDECRALVPRIKATVARFFNGLNESTIGDVIIRVDYRYHQDLLSLLATYKVYERCTAPTALTALDAAGVSLGEMLASDRLVRAYDRDLRERILSRPVNAEHIVRKYFEGDQRRAIHLPPSLNRQDERRLLNEYLDSGTANINYVELISLARLHADGALDAKTKLKAQRLHQQLTTEFFEQNQGTITGCELSVVDEQNEPVESSMDDMILKYSYSRRWLEETLDYPSVLNNFVYLFAFANNHMMLELPSYQAQLGIVDRFLRTTGRESYPAGVAFRSKESCSTLQVNLYLQWLQHKSISLESVISWFFSDYLKDRYGAEGFRYVASSQGASYLEKCRHMFAEMESIAKQFSLYVENGELDMDLLAIASEQVRYRELPSLIESKYVYLSDSTEILGIQYLLFSDQSPLAYINEDLQSDSFAELLTAKAVAFRDLEAYQQGHVRMLLREGVLREDNDRLTFSHAGQYRVLRHLSSYEAVSYRHYSTETRAIIDGMLQQGWLVSRRALLTEPEARYMNYCLNQVDFSDGPDLRNRYLHGSHADASDEDEHYRTYLTALKLMVALVIKVNDDFELHQETVN